MLHCSDIDENSTKPASTINLYGSLFTQLRMEYSAIINEYTNTGGSTSNPNGTNTTYSQVELVSEDVLFLQRIARGMDFWVPPFLFFIGLFNSTMVLLVMWGKHFRHMSTSFYMGVGAIVDTISLLIPLPVHYLYVNFPHIFDGIRHLHFICSICHATGRIIGNLAVVLTVAMTVDRSLAIQFPLKAPTLCTVRRAKIVTVCLSVAMILMEGHIIFTTRVVPKEIRAYMCAIDKYVSKAYEIFHDHYWPMMRNVFLVVSYVVLIMGNIIIILRVKRSEDSKDIGEGSKRAGGSQSEKMSSKSRQLSIMLIIDLASIIVCTMPFSLYVIVDESFQSSQNYGNSPWVQAERNLIFAMVFYLYYINHCTNFYLYCLSGSRFRQALKEVVSFKPRQKTTSVSKPSTSVTHSR